MVAWLHDPKHRGTSPWSFATSNCLGSNISSKGCQVLQVSAAKTSRIIGSCTSHYTSASLVPASLTAHTTERSRTPTPRRRPSAQWSFEELPHLQSRCVHLRKGADVSPNFSGEPYCCFPNCFLLHPQLSLRLRQFLPPCMIWTSPPPWQPHLASLAEKYGRVPMVDQWSLLSQVPKINWFSK